MTQTIERFRIEVLVDAPLVRRVTEAAEAAGVTGYTLLPTIAGSGSSGRWTDDQVSGAEAKLLFLTVTNGAKADRLIELLGDLLDTHGLIVLKSRVDVIRGAKF